MGPPIPACGASIPAHPACHPLQRTAVEEQIRHFGQTPMQLFRWVPSNCTAEVYRQTFSASFCLHEESLLLPFASCAAPTHTPNCRRHHPPRGPPPSPSQHPLLNGPDALRRTALALPPPHRSGIAISGLWVSDGRVLQLHADRAGERPGCARLTAATSGPAHRAHDTRRALMPLRAHPASTVATARWNAASRPDLAAFTFSSALLPDASASSLDPDPLPPRPLAGAWAAGAVGSGSAAGGGSSGAARLGQPSQAVPQAQFAVTHDDRVMLSGGYWDGSLRWVLLFGGGCRLRVGRAETCLATQPASFPCRTAAATSAQRVGHRQRTPGLPACPDANACRAHRSDDGRLLQSLAFHKDVVTCLASSSGEGGLTLLLHD